MELIYWSVGLSSKRGGKGVNAMDGGIFILARCVFDFIREHENLMYYPSISVSNERKYINMGKFVNSVNSALSIILDLVKFTTNGAVERIN